MFCATECIDNLFNFIVVRFLNVINLVFTFLGKTITQRRRKLFIDALADAPSFLEKLDARRYAVNFLRCLASNAKRKFFGDCSFVSKKTLHFGVYYTRGLQHARFLLQLKRATLFPVHTTPWYKSRLRAISSS